jgi:hypothetical protein
LAREHVSCHLFCGDHVASPVIITQTQGMFSLPCAEGTDSLMGLLQHHAQSTTDATTTRVGWWRANPLRLHALIFRLTRTEAAWHSPVCCFNNTFAAHCVATSRLQQAKLFHAVAQDVAGDAQEVSGPHLVVFGELQGLADQTIFDAVVSVTSMGQEDLF